MKKKKQMDKLEFKLCKNKSEKSKHKIRTPTGINYL